MTCRCVMCGRKSAGTNWRHRDYARAGLAGDEKMVHGREKKATRKLRRKREKRAWQDDQTTNSREAN